MLRTFSGLEQHRAAEIRYRIGEWEPPKDLPGVVSDLTGIIMNLCDEISRLEGELSDLRVKVDGPQEEGE